MNRPRTAPLAASPAMRLARRAWRLQYPDAPQSLALAERAAARAAAAGDVRAEGWARLARGFHRMRYAAAADAVAELETAQRCLRAVADRRGELLARVGIARCIWVQGRYRESLAQALALRDEGLALLRQEERGMLLNVIAGGYSALGASDDAFAYMYQALRESSATRNHGFDVVLYNNLAHELMQLGDYHEALRYLEEGIERCARLNNAYLLRTLLGNRVACLTDLGRPRAAVPDLHRLLELPAEVRGAQLETMAIAALRAGETALGAELVERGNAMLAADAGADERTEMTVAVADLLRAQGRVAEAAARLEAALPLPAEGLSLRVRCLFFQTLADCHEALGDSARALAHLRTWQQLHLERAQLASQARYQAASLQTELLRLQHERDEIEARRRSTERARAELEAINRALAEKIAEVQSLQAALKEQAVRDFLTGLFNRRHLNDVLPAMFALARRDDLPLAVAIVDLDRFKEVNDRYGHAAGDRVLAAFGELLGKRLRKSDIACRYGGEEFCLLLPHTEALAARGKIAALAKLWRAASFALEGATLTGQTFSAGIADSRLVPESAEALLKAADAAVLQAKRLGRNRLLIAAASTAGGRRTGKER
jgi:diguanylate cyclase (GGDEF)-like protein